MHVSSPWWVMRFLRSGTKQLPLCLPAMEHVAPQRSVHSVNLRSVVWTAPWQVVGQRRHFRPAKHPQEPALSAADSAVATVVPSTNSLPHKTGETSESGSHEAVASNSSRVGRDVAWSMDKPRKLWEASPVVWPAVYVELGKGKLSALVTFTAAAGYAVAIPAGAPFSLHMLGIACSGTMLSAMGASAFNQIWEIKNDKEMTRTVRRPLPSGRISILHATVAASVSSIAGVGILALYGNTLMASLAAGNIIIYTLCYTPMKQRSMWNTWVGAIVGAIPPMIGWAGATGCLDFGAWLMGGLLFSWQMPHFLSLAYMMRADYRAGGYVMMPGDAGSPGLARATRAAMRHCLFLEMMCVAAPALGLVDPVFAVEATILNAGFYYLALQFHHAGTTGAAGKTNTAARRLFLSSLLYLPLLLSLMVFHRAAAVESHSPDAAATAAACPYLEAQRVVAAGDAQRDVLPPAVAVAAAAAVPAAGDEEKGSAAAATGPAPAPVRHSRRVHG